MLDKLLLHDTAGETLNALAAQPPQGILLSGPTGIGKRTIAQAWAQGLVTHPTNVRIISPDDRGTITIEIIRNLYATTRAKQDGQQVVIIEQADCLSLEAENAFLKLLEEPRPGLTFVLTVVQPEKLLPTILSRVQRIQLQPLPDEVIRRAIINRKPGLASVDLTQIVFLAQGCPGVAIALLADNQLPEQRERIQLIKQLLTAKPYERFRLLGRLGTDREACLTNLQAMMRIVEVQLRAATSPAQLQHWIELASALEDALGAITHNGNVRAQLLYLFSRS